MTKNQIIKYGVEMGEKDHKEKMPYDPARYWHTKFVDNFALFEKGYSVGYSGYYGK